VSSDATTTVGELRAAVKQFVDERDWNQFHNPKNLSMALAIEAAELMEHFQWLDAGGARGLARSPERMLPIQEELADVLCFALSFANALEIDISAAVRDKLVKNARKYPADRYRGRFD
jgi:NTP pyrophosphatase (non-canonical NTP hydrolase)